jgi:putative ABC transport system permease protein
MLFKLIFNSFRRDARRKAVGISAVALATCLATFLLNWSLNLGDKIQKDLRAYGANILITPQGESLPLVSENADLGYISTDQYLDYREISKLSGIFWTNQILAYAPLLPQQVLMSNHLVTFQGSEFGEREARSALQKAAPYISIRGKWPVSNNEVVVGQKLADRDGLYLNQQLTVVYNGRKSDFRVSGIAQSGGVEDHEIFGRLSQVQQLTGHPEQFKQLLVSAIVSPQDPLYYRFHHNPRSLNSEEYERYSCTPYVTSIAAGISKIFTGSEARVVLQISQTEEKISKKVNWLMLLVTLAALVASSLTMTSTTTAMILERRKELALMKAIGSRSGFLIFYLLAEVLILGIIGSLAGYAIGSAISIGLSKSFFQATLELKLIVLPVVAIIGILIIILGSLFPLRQAIALEPARALKNL